MSECVGLRERKKRRTRLDLHHAAVHLVDAEDLESVTVDRIAAQAGVSTRTFFNYYPSKESAILGFPEDMGRIIQEAFGERPAGEPVWQSVLAVMQAVTSGQVEDRTVVRRVVGRYPELVQGLTQATSGARQVAHREIAARLEAEGRGSAEAECLAAVYLDLAQSVFKSSVRMSRIDGVPFDEAARRVQRIAVEAMGEAGAE